jgi:gliding motility-associated lipoprotein GldJ
MKITKNTLLLALVAVFIWTGCKDSSRSMTTGWKYNDQEWGGYEDPDFEQQETGPNLVLIPGGTFTMGMVQEDVTYEWNNTPRRVTVSSFYIDQTEVPNLDYRFYTEWKKRHFMDTYPEVYFDALPDTLVWREELAYNDPLVYNYFRYPAYDNYPVVGVTWEQATQFCLWRTDRVNQTILIERGILNPPGEAGGGGAADTAATDGDGEEADFFTTEAYYAGQYDGNVRKNVKDIRTGGERSVRKSDGIMLPNYRLPTEAEWEYAALALIGNHNIEESENITDRRFFPWDGYTARYQIRDKYQGDMLANFKRGAGDYMGMAGNLNDDASTPAPVRSYYPNDFGLFNMAGNVSEWTRDVYRPLTYGTLSDAEQHDLNPFRGNVFKVKVKDEEGNLVEKDSLGRIPRRIQSDEELEGRRNYRESDLRDYEDGDTEDIVYSTGEYTLISDSTRVVKGGSWADRLYWLSPGARRNFDQDKASSTIGFRCAMNRLGAATNEGEAGNLFKSRARKVGASYK